MKPILKARFINSNSIILYISIIPCTQDVSISNSIIEYFSQLHYIFQGVGVSLMLVQGMSGVYSIVITSWMFVYFRDSFITIHQPYKWSRCEKDVPAFENLRHCHQQNANQNWSLEQVIESIIIVLLLNCDT